MNEHVIHIVALSGGKDSTALALRLQEVEPRDYVYICTPTGDELPEMEEHWDRLEALLGQPLIRLRNQADGFGSLEDGIKTKKCLPNFRIRWCTEILKIIPAKEFYVDHSPCEIYVGLRADEEARDGMRTIYGVEQRFPLRERGWGLKEVLQYLQQKGVKIPARTDCGMCFYQKIGEWWNLWKYYPHRFGLYEGYEAMLGQTLLAPGKFGKSWPHALRDIRREFEKGRRPRKAGMKNLFEDEGKCRVCSL